MKCIRTNTQLINTEEINLIEVEKVNDYLKVSILKKEKFKYKAIAIDKKYSSISEFDPEFSKNYFNIDNNRYVKINKIMMIERKLVQETVQTIDITIHFTSNEPLIFRANNGKFDELTKRMYDY